MFFLIYIFKICLKQNFVIMYGQNFMLDKPVNQEDEYYFELVWNKLTMKIVSLHVFSYWGPDFLIQ